MKAANNLGYLLLNQLDPPDLAGPVLIRRVRVGEPVPELFAASASPA